MNKLIIIGEYGERNYYLGISVEEAWIRFLKQRGGEKINYPPEIVFEFVDEFSDLSFVPFV